MLQTIEVEIDASGRIQMIEPCYQLPPGRALLTLLQPMPSSRERDAGSRLGTDNHSSVLMLLRSSLFQNAPTGDPARLEETIQANRAAWDDR